MNTTESKDLGHTTNKVIKIQRKDIKFNAFVRKTVSEIPEVKNVVE